VFGDRTIRGITRQVVRDHGIEHLDERDAVVTATTSSDRRDFGVGLKASRVMVGNTVTVRINLALRVREPAS